MLNVTPDSFSDGGNFLSHTDAVARAGEMLAEGADVIEVGGESTRPGAQPVDAASEIGRVLPVIAGIRARWPDARVAIDTVKSAVAQSAIEAGATIVNDVSALRLDPSLAGVAAAAGATLVLMHSRGTVADMARFDHAEYPTGVMDAVIAELEPAAECATRAGVPRERIVLDPGIGFSKRGSDSVTALAELPRLVELGFAVMVGASRKRFIGEITGVQHAADRDAGTLGAHVAALMLGARWIRAHEVRMHRQALDVASAILEARG